MHGKQKQKYAVGMAGEYFVAAELIRRGAVAFVTLGNAKRADIIVTNTEGKNVTVLEVKSSQKQEWVVGNAIPTPCQQPWVFVHVPLDIGHPRYFVLTAKDLHSILLPRDQAYQKRFEKRNGKPFTGKGVVKITMADAEPVENSWDTILEQIN